MQTAEYEFLSKSNQIRQQHLDERQEWPSFSMFYLGKNLISIIGYAVVYKYYANYLEPL